MTSTRCSHQCTQGKAPQRVPHCTIYCQYRNCTTRISTLIQESANSGLALEHSCLSWADVSWAVSHITRCQCIYNSLHVVCRLQTLTPPSCCESGGSRCVERGIPITYCTGHRDPPLCPVSADHTHKRS